MGFGTTLVTDIYYNRKTYNHKYEVENDLDEVNDVITTLENDIRGLVVCTEPAKMMPQDEGWEPLEWLLRVTETKFKDLKEAITEKNDLMLLLEKWDDCHTKDGKAISCPDEFACKSYLDGDFVVTDKYNNENEGV